VIFFLQRHRLARVLLLTSLLFMVVYHACPKGNNAHALRPIEAYCSIWLLLAEAYSWLVAADCATPFTPPGAVGQFQEQRAKLINQFKSSASSEPNEWVLALGNPAEVRSNSDTGVLFRQDSNFLYVLSSCLIF